MILTHHGIDSLRRASPLGEYIILTYFDEKSLGIFESIYGGDSNYTPAYKGQENNIPFNTIGNLPAGLFQQYGQSAGQILMEYSFDVDVITIDFFIKQKDYGTWGGIQNVPETTLIDSDGSIMLGTGWSPINSNFTLYNGWYNVSYGFLKKSGVTLQAHVALVFDKVNKECYCFCNGLLAYKIANFTFSDTLYFRRTGEPTQLHNIYVAQYAVRRGDYSNNRTTFPVPTQPYWPI